MPILYDLSAFLAGAGAVYGLIRMRRTSRAPYHAPVAAKAAPAPEKPPIAYEPAPRPSARSDDELRQFMAAARWEAHLRRMAQPPQEATFEDFQTAQKGEQNGN